MLGLKGQHHFASSHPCYTPWSMSPDACSRSELNCALLGLSRAGYSLTNHRETCAASSVILRLCVSKPTGVMSRTWFDWLDDAQEDDGILGAEGIWKQLADGSCKDHV